MIKIPQHTESGRLNDLQRFLEDLDRFQRKVDYWLIELEEFIGEGSIAFEELSRGGAKLSPLGFSSLCQCINQTIDGVFSGFLGDREIIRLMAVDSSYWEITASPEFEDIMLNKYGPYIS
jgi:hypothetical protein